MKLKFDSKSMCLAVTLVGAASSIRAAEFTVTRTNISGPGSLQAVVAQMNATPGNHTVRFGVTGTITLETSLPQITNNVVIEGRDDLTISGGGKVSLFSFASNVTAAFSGLTLADGYSTNGGPAIWNAGDLLVANCVFTGNSGGVYGGAVYNANEATLAVQHSTFTNNTASPGWGGGIWSAGDMIVTASTFVSNASRGGDGVNGSYGGGGGGAGFGGGLFVESGVVSLTNCTFSGNSVSGGSGGSRAGNPGGGVGGGPFPQTGGSAGFGTGGEGYQSAGQVGGFGAGRGGYFDYGTGGSGMGGAIFIKAGALDVVNCTIVSNRCVAGGSGGSGTNGVTVAGGIHQYGGIVNLANTLVEMNAADSSGDLNGTFRSQGYNIIGNNTGASGLTAFDYQNEFATIGPLQDNGGLTWTHLLLAGSTAIDAGASLGAPVTDQRGALRPEGAAIDIGAVGSALTLPPTDSDNDGLSDTDETNVYHTNRNLADTDGDSFSDGFEVQNKSDPNDATSVPETVRVYTAVELEIFTNLGHKYQMEVSANLANWTEWGAVFDGVGGKSGQLVSIKGTNQSYWRLKRVQ